MRNHTESRREDVALIRTLVHRRFPMKKIEGDQN
jgi:hypothetical protein